MLYTLSLSYPARSLNQALKNTPATIARMTRMNNISVFLHISGEGEHERVKVAEGEDTAAEILWPKLAFF